jgi:glycosyltransferase involved in cell wall biosynthesis
MRGPSVLHVIGGGDTGGAMTHLLPLLSALRRAGCDVHLLCLGEGGLAEEALRRSLSVTVLPMDRPWDPSVLRPVRRLLAGGPADLEALRARGAVAGPEPAGRIGRPRWDVVHTHGMRANLPVRLAVKGRRRRPCLFTTVHSDLRLDYASPHLARFYQGLDRATLSSVDTVICVSDALRSLLRGRGYPAGRLLTVHSGLELPADDAAAAVEGAEVALVAAGGGAEMAWPSGAGPRVGTVARLVPVKDIDLLLEVAGLLCRTTPGVEVVIVGDGPEQARLEARTQAQGLEKVVRFAGRVDSVAQVLADWGVYLVTSVFEGGVSMAVLEAMAAGIPVVTTAAGGVTEAVRDGETGFVVSRDQARGALAATLAESATTLLRDEELRSRMGAAGAKRVRELFTAERAAAATLRAYERCLAARGT